MSEHAAHSLRYVSIGEFCRADLDAPLPIARGGEAVTVHGAIQLLESLAGSAVPYESTEFLSEAAREDNTFLRQEAARNGNSLNRSELAIGLVSRRPPEAAGREVNRFASAPGIYLWEQKTLQGPVNEEGATCIDLLKSLYDALHYDIEVIPSWDLPTELQTLAGTTEAQTDAEDAEVQRLVGVRVVDRYAT